MFGSYKNSVYICSRQLGITLQNQKQNVMKNSRITIKGYFTENEKIIAKVIRTDFTGEGALDFTDKVIFQGEESVKENQINLDELTADEYSQFERDAERYFKEKYCKNNEDFYFDVE